MLPGGGLVLPRPPAENPMPAGNGRPTPGPHRGSEPVESRKVLAPTQANGRGFDLRAGAPAEGAIAVGPFRVQLQGTPPVKCLPLHLWSGNTEGIKVRRNDEALE